jgi:hypothetical protein
MRATENSRSGGFDRRLPGALAGMACAGVTVLGFFRVRRADRA